MDTLIYSNGRDVYHMEELLSAPDQILYSTPYILYKVKLSTHPPTVTQIAGDDFSGYREGKGKNI